MCGIAGLINRSGEAVDFGVIKNMTDATVIVPLIKDYIDASLKNDDHLIKMAGIIQRASQRAETSGGDFSLSDDEKKQLIESIEEIEKTKEN